MYYQDSLYPGFIVWTLFGALVLVTLSFLIVTPFITSRVHKLVANFSGRDNCLEWAKGSRNFDHSNMFDNLRPARLGVFALP